MKNNKILLALALVLGLTACKADSYKSVRHPEGEENQTQLVGNDDDLAQEVKNEQKAKENEDASKDQSQDSQDDNSTLPEGVEFKVSDIVNMRLAPSENSAIVTEVRPEDEILNLGETEGWTRVTTNGKTGYIRSDLLIKK